MSRARPRTFVGPDGEARTIREWSERSGIPANVLYERLVTRGPDGRAITTPVGATRKVVSK